MKISAYTEKIKTETKMAAGSSIANVQAGALDLWTNVNSAATIGPTTG